MSPHGVHARKQTAFRLPPELLARLETAASQRGETKTSIVIRAITAELDRIGHQEGGDRHGQGR